MYKVKLYNNIAQVGLNQFNDQYQVDENIQDEDAILVRSANLHDIEYSPNLKCIARAGAGTNNIDIQTCTEKGIVVFNTPGANSNAVKDLVFAGMLMASRDIYGGIAWAKTQEDNENLAKDIEKQKKQYAGNELKGFGNLILVKHSGGWITAYAHNDRLFVKKGQKVRKGHGRASQQQAQRAVCACRTRRLCPCCTCPIPCGRGRHPR